MNLDSTGLWDAAQRRRMLTPLLLYWRSHAPLAFVAGQALYVVAPLAGLLGWSAPQAWAGALSWPRTGARRRDAAQP